MLILLLSIAAILLSVLDTILRSSILWSVKTMSVYLPLQVLLKGNNRCGLSRLRPKQSAIPRRSSPGFLLPVWLQMPALVHTVWGRFSGACSCPVRRLPKRLPAGLKARGFDMGEIKKALSIAGSDPCAGAGLQADLKTFHAHGVYGLTAVTAVTVQNTQQVGLVQEMPSEIVRDQ